MDVSANSRWAGKVTLAERLRWLPAKHTGVQSPPGIGFLWGMSAMLSTAADPVPHPARIWAGRLEGADSDEQPLCERGFRFIVSANLSKRSWERGGLWFQEEVKGRVDSHVAFVSEKNKLFSLQICKYLLSSSLMQLQHSKKQFAKLTKYFWF